MLTTIDEAFARATEVNASTHDLASSLAIAIWREMNNWQGEDKDRDFIKLHAGAKRVQEEITIMSRGIRLILEAERHRCRLAVCPLCNAGEAVEKHESGVWYHSDYRLCRAYKILEMDSECS